MKAKSIRIIKPDNLAIAALAFLPPQACKYILVVCHGFRGTKENGGKICGFAKRLNDIGIGVYALDFLGSGESDGEFADVTLSRQADDLFQVIKFIDENHKAPMVLLGRSFGGSTVIKAGKHPQVAGCILWSTPARLQETFAVMLGEAYQELEAGQEVCFSDEGGLFVIGPALVNDFACHEMKAYLKSLEDRPLLIIQGLNDETVDPANAQFIHSHCPNADLILVEGADHRFSNQTREREELTIEWLKKRFIN